MGRSRARRPGEVSGGIEEVARDQAGPQSEAPCRLGEHRREVAARSASVMKRLRRRPRALLVACLIGEVRRDAGADVLQEGQGVGRPSAHEPLDPPGETTVHVGVDRLRQGPEVGPLVVRVEERVVDRVRRDREDRPERGTGFENRPALHDHPIRRGPKHGLRDRVSHYVLGPCEFGRGRRVDLVRDELVLAGLPRPQDQLLDAQHHRAAIDVGGPVERAHRLHRGLHAGLLPLRFVARPSDPHPEETWRRFPRYRQMARAVPRDSAAGAQVMRARAKRTISAEASGPSGSA